MPASGVLPLLARAAPRCELAAGTLKSASYADGHWTLDPIARRRRGIAELDTQLKEASVPRCHATSAAGRAFAWVRCDGDSAASFIRRRRFRAGGCRNREPNSALSPARASRVRILCLVDRLAAIPATYRHARGNARGSIARRCALTEEMAGLARASAPAGDADPRTDLDRVLVAQNLRAVLTQQDWKDGRARLVFGAVNCGTGRRLRALQRDARLRIVEATHRARRARNSSAELVLARGAPIRPMRRALVILTSAVRGVAIRNRARLARRRGAGQPRRYCALAGADGTIWRDRGTFSPREWSRPVAWTIDPWSMLRETSSCVSAEPSQIAPR
jgi:hypothetical protein